MRPNFYEARPNRACSWYDARPNVIVVSTRRVRIVLWLVRFCCVCTMRVRIALLSVRSASFYYCNQYEARPKNVVVRTRLVLLKASIPATGVFINQDVRPSIVFSLSYLLLFGPQEYLAHMKPPAP